MGFAQQKGGGATMPAGPNDMTASIRIGRTQVARLKGPHVQVLSAWAMLLTALVITAFLALNSPACSVSLVQSALTAMSQ